MRYYVQFLFLPLSLFSFSEKIPSYRFLNQINCSLFSNTPGPKKVHTTRSWRKRNLSGSNSMASWYLSEGLDPDLPVSTPFLSVHLPPGPQSGISKMQMVAYLSLCLQPSAALCYPPGEPSLLPPASLVSGGYALPQAQPQLTLGSSIAGHVLTHLHTWVHVFLSTWNAGPQLVCLAYPTQPPGLC